LPIGRFRASHVAGIGSGLYLAHILHLSSPQHAAEADDP
jgi:hypothetical protein